MREGNFVLTVVVVPDVEPAVLASKEKGAHSGGRETAVAEVAGVVSGLNQRSLEVVHPDLGAPVAHRHEHLRELQVPSDRVNGPEVAVVKAESVVNFNRLF